jgi:hypothetical protein
MLFCFVLFLEGKKTRATAARLMAGAAINSKIPSEADRWFCAHVHLMLTGQNCEARQGRAGQNRVGRGRAELGRAGRGRTWVTQILTACMPSCIQRHHASPSSHDRTQHHKCLHTFHGPHAHPAALSHKHDHNLWTIKVGKAAVTSSVTSSALIFPSPSPYRLPACRKWATV